MIEPLPLSVIQPAAVYNVMMDSARRESILANGSRIINWRGNRDFQHFRSIESLPKNYAPVTIGAGDFLGVWCDPTKPELAWYREETVETPVNKEVEAEKPVDAENFTGLAVTAARNLIRSTLSGQPVMDAVND